MNSYQFFWMKKRDLILDFTKFNDLTTIKQTQFITISESKKKYSPSRRYFFKKFNYYFNPEKQKIVVETFLKIDLHENQYIQSYNNYSLHTNNQNTPIFSRKYIHSFTTLEEILQKNIFSNEWKIIDMMNCIFAVAEGMKYLHNKNIIHGNLCPSNIIVDFANQCYICDFSLYPIKKVYYKEEELFNKNYQDPFMESNNPTKSSDVYSYGILICELYRSFFYPRNHDPIKTFIQRKDPSTFSELGKSFPQWISLCLNPSLEKRPTFEQITNFFSCSVGQIDSFIIKDQYKKFLKINYTLTLARKQDPFALIKLGKKYKDGIGVDKDPNKALNYFAKAANLNDSEGQYLYGNMLMNDPLKEKMAMAFLKLSADEENIHGMAFYGIALRKKAKSSNEQIKALNYIKRSAKLGFTTAQINYATILLNGNPTEEQKEDGIEFLKMAIRKGDRDAYYIYGMILKSGDVIQKDMIMAMEYFKVAADMGNTSAMIEYGDGNCHGVGVPQNYSIAKKYYENAMKKGNENARIKLIQINQMIKEKKIYEINNTCHNEDNKTLPFNGNYIVDNKKQSDSTEKEGHMNQNLAGKKDQNPPKRLSFVPSKPNEFDKIKSVVFKFPKHIIDTQISDFSSEINYDENTDKKEISTFFKKLKSKNLLEEYEDKLIKINNPFIFYKYGKYYYSSDKTNEIKKSMKYFQKAADLGSAKAQIFYGIALYSGENVKMDKELSIKYFEKAAKQGNAEGKCNLGIALYNKNEKKLGLRYLKEAANKDHPLAQLYYGKSLEDKTLRHKYIENAYYADCKEAPYYLAKDYKNGYGVKENIEKAIEILQQSYEMHKQTKDLRSLIKYLKNVDIKEALKYLKIMADTNDKDFISDIHEAQYQYAAQLAKGKYIEQNIEEAKKYFIKSSKYELIKSKFPDIYSLISNDFSSDEAIDNNCVYTSESNLCKSIIKDNELNLNRDDIKTSNNKSNFNNAETMSNDDEPIYSIDKSKFNDDKSKISYGESNTSSDESRITIDKSEIGTEKPKPSNDKSKSSNDDETMSNEDESTCRIDESIFYNNETMSNDDEPTIIVDKSRSNSDKSKYSRDESKFSSKEFINGNHKSETEINEPKSSNDELKSLNDEYIIGNDESYYDNNESKSDNYESKSDNNESKSDNYESKSDNNESKSDNYESKSDNYESKSDNNDFLKISDELHSGNNESMPNIDDPIINFDDIIFDYEASINNLYELISNESFLNIDESILYNGSSDEFTLNCDVSIHDNDEITLNDEREYSDDSQTDFNDDEFIIETNSSPDELFSKGINLQNENKFIDAFHYFKAAAEKGKYLAYMKCAEISSSLEEKLENYELAIKYQVPNAFDKWRKSILKHVSLFRSNQSKYVELSEKFARNFESKKDFSDACFLYLKAKKLINFHICYEKAQKNIENIRDADQQLLFATIAEKKNDINLSIKMYTKAYENGIQKAYEKVCSLKQIQKNKLNSTESFLEKGIAFLEGKNGTQIDLEKAFSIFNNKSLNGNRKTDFYLGEYYKKTGQYDTCFQYYKKSADSGDLDGLNACGDCFLFGKGVKKNISQAINCYKMAAEKGNGKALYNYAQHLRITGSTEAEQIQYNSYIKQAAEKLVPDALYNYSKLIQKVNPIDSKKFFEFSIEIGSELAIKEHGKQLKQNNQKDEAIKLFKKAADKDLLIGHRKYAKYILNNYQNINDNYLALKYFKRAAEIGEVKDYYKYASFLYRFFHNIFKVECANYFKKAADENYAKAFFYYAECLKNGYGVEKNCKEAGKYFELSFKKDPNSPVKQRNKQLQNNH